MRKPYRRKQAGRFVRAGRILNDLMPGVLSLIMMGLGARQLWTRDLGWEGLPRLIHLAEVSLLFILGSFVAAISFIYARRTARTG